MKYRKIPVVIEATQWFKNGDHPEDVGSDTEGEVVRYFRHPKVNEERACRHCHRVMKDHGWIDTPEGGHIVCPGDWIITGIKGEHYPVKPQIFDETYEPVDDAPEFGFDDNSSISEVNHGNEKTNRVADQSIPA